TAPISTTGRGPQRSDKAPQPKPASPMLRKAKVIALEMPARDLPVSADIGCRKTASAKMTPTATQPISAPAATISHLVFGCSVAGRSPAVDKTEALEFMKAPGVMGGQSTRTQRAPGSNKNVANRTGSHLDAALRSVHRT